MNNKVAILLVLHNEEKHIERLARSINEQSYKNISVFAIDNNSEDDSISLLLDYIPDADITRSKNNLGYAKGNNIIAAKAIEKSYELLFILNTDMELDRNCIEILVKYFDDDDTAIAAPVVYHGRDGLRTDNVQCYAIAANYSTATTNSLYTGSDCILPEKLNVTSMHGGCFMIRSSTVSEVGLFNEDNFMYNDELDLSYRLYKNKKKLIAVNNAYAWHYHDWSGKNKTGFYLQYYYINRNRFLFFYRYNKYFSFVRVIVPEIFLFPVKVKWAKRTADLKLLKYYYLGYWHGLLKKKGRADIEFR